RMVIQNTSKVEILVLDAGPIIKLGARIKDYAQEFVTVPEVIREVRDFQARHQLAIFPFEIKFGYLASRHLKLVRS
ncbi:hypothetical protein L0F63_000921, partial [Massospora cicadina]